MRVFLTALSLACLVSVGAGVTPAPTSDVSSRPSSGRIIDNGPELVAADD